jgi:putative transposase
LSLPKFQDGIKINFHREFSGAIKDVTISKEPSGKYYASFLVNDGKKIPEKKPVASSTSIGIDLGLKYFAVLSDGTEIGNERHLKKNLRKLKNLQRKNSKKKNGSKRKERSAKKIALLHDRVAHQRADFLHKLSDEITNRFDTICMEDLQVKNMVKNKKLSRAISDAGWGMFRRMIEYKCESKGKTLLIADKFFASSKTCSNCGAKNEFLTLADREWTCATCRTLHDRDKNAAVMIKQESLRIWGLEQPCRDIEGCQTGAKNSGKPVEMSKILEQSSPGDARFESQRL